MAVFFSVVGIYIGTLLGLMLVTQHELKLKAEGYAAMIAALRDGKIQTSAVFYVEGDTVDGPSS